MNTRDDYWLELGDWHVHVSTNSAVIPIEVFSYLCYVSGNKEKNK